MSVGFGSPLTSANTNGAFVSRTQDTTMVGKLDNTNATDSTATTNGALHLAGGLGVEKKAHINQVFIDSLGGNRALVTDASKEVIESVTTDVELSYVSGATSSLQPQIDSKANDSDVVHNTGNESVAGVKTFTDDMIADQDLTVNGDFTVNGTTTTVNTATLDVTDTNITVNNTGNDASSEGAGLTVDRTGTQGSLVYANALASRFKAGDLGSESEIITAGTNQTISGNKTSSGKLNLNGELNLGETIDTATTGAAAVLPSLTPAIRITNASLVSISNVDDVSFGKLVLVTNNTGNPVVITNDSGGTAIKRIVTGTGADFNLLDNASVILSYNSNLSRWMISGGSGAGSSNVNTEFRTISGPEEAAKIVVLAYTPTIAGNVLVDIISGGAQEFAVDYTVVGDEFRWNGYALDGILAAGDKIRFHYQY